MNIRKCRMNEFLDKIGNKKIICFGFGIQARTMCDNYKDLLNHIEFFVDNDIKKQGVRKINENEFRVFSTEYFLSLDSYNDIVMLITTKFFNEIIQQFDNNDKLENVDLYIYPLMEEMEEEYDAKDCEIEKTSSYSIPKTIHYCWFGKNKKSDMHEKCINSWKEKCPNYEIIEWNEDNFDININTYVKQAYDSKKYAFVSDFARLYILYNYGGIYLDTDVEIIKPLDELLFVPGFTSFETRHHITTGIIASIKGNEWIKELMDSYENDSFLDEEGNLILITNVERITKISKEKYGLIPNGNKQKLKSGIVIYPRTYFSPKSLVTGKINISDNTYVIHHFDLSWFPKGIKQRSIDLENYFDKLEWSNLKD